MTTKPIIKKAIQKMIRHFSVNIYFPPEDGRELF